MGGAESRDRKRHGQSVIAGGVRDAAGQPAGARDVKTIRKLLRIGPQRAQAGDERRDPVALLDPQLAGTRHRHRSAVGGERGQCRQFVDQPWHLVRLDHERHERAVSDPQIPRGFGR
jgi:hypothetical protein